MISFPALVLALLLVLLFAGEDPARRPFGIITALAIVATPILGRNHSGSNTQLVEP